MARQYGLVLQAMWELVRFDLVLRMFGFGVMRRGVSRLLVRAGSPQADVHSILAAMNFATSLYWRPVPCLQRSVATVRLLRRCGVEANLVIAFRSLPLFGHAWVEINGRVVNDSPAYRLRLQVVDSLSM